MSGLTGVSLPVAKHCKEAADLLFLGSAYKGAGGKQPARKVCGHTVGSLECAPPAGARRPGRGTCSAATLWVP